MATSWTDDSIRKLDSHQSNPHPSNCLVHFKRRNSWPLIESVDGIHLTLAGGSNGRGQIHEISCDQVSQDQAQQLQQQPYFQLLEQLNSFKLRSRLLDSMYIESSRRSLSQPPPLPHSSDCSLHHSPSDMSSISAAVGGSFSRSLTTSEWEFRFHNEVGLLYDELNEMRSVLTQLLLQNPNHNFQLGDQTINADDVLASLIMMMPTAEPPPAPPSSRRESSPGYPIGDLHTGECLICYEVKSFNMRPCCAFGACDSCMRQYFRSKIEQGCIAIECINTRCHAYVHRDEIFANLSGETKHQYYRLLTARNLSPTSKTCPRCNHLLNLDENIVNKMHSYKSTVIDDTQIIGTSDGPSTLPKVTCHDCDLNWCFLCHSPWHQNMSCKQFRKGDRLLKLWAKQINHGQVNAQKCPKCKVFIQRSSGCDHMHCIQCKTDFCYKCGERLRRVKFFGDHYSKFSIFGCKYRYKAEHPIQRKLIRGAVFGTKVLCVPVLGSLAAIGAVVVVTVGVAALPLYGGVKLYQHFQDKRYMKAYRGSYTIRSVNAVPDAPPIFPDEVQSRDDNAMEMRRRASAPAPPSPMPAVVDVSDFADTFHSRHTMRHI